MIALSSIRLSSSSASSRDSYCCPAGPPSLAAARPSCMVDSRAELEEEEAKVDQTRSALFGLQGPEAAIVSPSFLAPIVCEAQRAAERAIGLELHDERAHEHNQRARGTSAKAATPTGLAQPPAQTI